VALLGEECKAKAALTGRLVALADLEFVNHSNRIKPVNCSSRRVGWEDALPTSVEQSNGHSDLLKMAIWEFIQWRIPGAWLSQRQIG